MRSAWAFCWLSLLYAFSPAAIADVPEQFQRTARAIDAQSNLPLEGLREVTVRIYDAPDLQPRDAFYVDTRTLEFNDGVFTINSPVTESLSALLRDGGQLYLGIQIGDDSELQPRLPLSGAFYAQLARDVSGDINPRSVSIDGLVVIDEQGRWRGDPAGLTGPMGPQGVPGLQGVIGPLGPQGPAGLAGAEGPMGPQGPAGVPGAAGPMGLQGLPGVDGAPGLAGADGDEGLSCWDLDGDQTPDVEEDINNDGVHDARDCQGPAGLAGDTGAAGPAGATGLQGPAGVAGAEGPMGPQGPAGVPGAAGPMGLQGLPGVDGAPGLAGADGDEGLSCWDLDGDQMPDVEEDINNDGVHDARDCQGPAGLAGDTGPVGPAGATGLQGPAGVAGAEGPMGPQGPAGVPGAEGPMGPQGPAGVAGAEGPMGLQGVPGVEGPAGPKGDTGDAGESCSFTQCLPTADSPSGETILTCGQSEVRFACITEVKLVFVTSTLYSPNFGTLAQADQVCNEEAADAGLPGSYVAWLSDTTENAPDRMSRFDPQQGVYERGWMDSPLYTLDGARVKDNGWFLVQTWFPDSPLGVDVNGEAVAGTAWTGTSREMIADSETCENWTSMGPSRGMAGDISATTDEWTETGRVQCDTNHRLYCMGQ